MKRICLLLFFLALSIPGMRLAPGAAYAAASPNTWTTEPSLNTARAYPAVIAGAGSDTHIYAIAGQSSSSTWLSSEEGFTPGGTSWTALSNSYGTTAAGVGAAASSTTLYGFGGDSSGTAGTSAYSDTNPSTTAWTSLSKSLPTARTHLGGAFSASTGLVYAIGGNSGSTYLTNNEAYSPSSSKWTTEAAMPTARAYLGVVAASNGLIYAIGGRSGSTYLSTVEAYNPSTNTWTCSTGDASSGCSSTTIAPMPTARTATGIATANGIIYVFGGYNGSSYLSYVEAFNPSTNQWECSSGDAASGCTATPLTAMPTARAYLGAALASDGNIYAVGGLSGTTYLKTVEMYGPLTTPGAPTGVTATAGDQSATVSWTAPASTGGTPITTYTVTCSPSCTGASTSSTSATISGLTNGTAYTFSVTATNFVGTGSAGTSGSVTPGCSTSTSSLAVSGAAIGNFSVTLNGSDQQVYTTLGTYTASNTTCSGWNLQMQATHLTNTGGDSFPAGSLLMAAPTVSSCQSGCGTGSHANAPSICIHTATAALDGSTAVTVASAAQNTGEGSYTFTPGTVGTGNLQLTVPSYAYATTYTSTLTVTIVQGPATTC